MTRVIDQLVEELWPGRSLRVEELVGGHTNANYLVDLGDDQVVLRIPGNNTHLLGIDRNHEYEANLLASSIGVGPDVIARSDVEGWMVTRFLPGQRLTSTDLATQPRLSDVATTLRRIHGAGRIGTVFNPFLIVRNYHEIVCEHDVVDPFDYTLALARLDRIDEVRNFRPTSFCHNDLLNTNFVLDTQLRVLDWEYAGMGDPFFDLANFSANNHLSKSADEQLLTSYFGTCDESLAAVLKLMKVVSELREIMWNLVQHCASTLDLDYAEFARARVVGYERLIDEMDFAETIQLAKKLP
ncbi:MAG TPA: choline/ethanolamine kinase family protein [Acidimicrobiales bacterium]